MIPYCEGALTVQGGQMISNKCKIEDFFKRVDGRDRLEAIHLANLEITEAQRRQMALRADATNPLDTKPDYVDYSESLKEFIHFVRYSVRPKLADASKSQLFRSYLDSAPIETDPRLP
jgi:hypothetical protein